MNRYPMMRTLELFLMLQLAGARLLNENFNLYTNYSMSFLNEDFSFNETWPKGKAEIFIETPELCIKETTLDRGNIEITLREVWVNESNQKLLFILEDGVIINCTDKYIGENEKNMNCTSKFLLMEKYEKTRVENYNPENNSSFPKKLSWLSSAANLLRQCNDMKFQIKNQIIHQQRQWNQPNTWERSQEWEKSHNRSKRELFIFPGTQWCGRGTLATTYTDLGGFSKADICCRKHDTACPISIPPMESRFGYYNWGLATIMHCTCDERFRTCLKLAQTVSADMVGQLFFNVLQTKCFLLKKRKKKLCTEWSKKGKKCSRYEKYRVKIRNNKSY